MPVIERLYGGAFRLAPAGSGKTAWRAVRGPGRSGGPGVGRRPSDPLKTRQPNFGGAVRRALGVAVGHRAPVAGRGAGNRMLEIGTAGMMSGDGERDTGVVRTGLRPPRYPTAGNRARNAAGGSAPSVRTPDGALAGGQLFCDLPEGRRSRRIRSDHGDVAVPATGNSMTITRSRCSATYPEATCHSTRQRRGR